MSRYGQCSDEELIERLRNGESKISDYLMEKYKGTVKKRARAMYLIGGETDDLIQEGMIGLFKAVQDYRPDREASFRTFAGLCIDRQLYSAVKNSTRQKHIPLNSYVSLSEEEESGPMENKVLDYYLRGYGYVQIAEIMGKTPKSIDNALQRIRGKIRTCIEKFQI